LKQARRNAVKLVGERSSSLDLARGRIVLMNAAFITAYMLLGARAVDLMVIQARPAQMSGSEIASEMQAKAPAVLRADITDRHGELLATTVKTASLYADPRLISDPRKAAEDL